MREIRLTRLVSAFLIAYLVLTLIYRISGYIGEGSSQECGFAILSVAGIWLISLLLNLFRGESMNGFIIAFFVGSAVRMVLIAAAVAAAIHFGDFKEFALLVWTAVIYLLFLAVDVVRSLKYIRQRNWEKKDFFAEKRNEIYINNNKSS